MWGSESSNGFSEDPGGEGERIFQKQILSFLKFHLWLTPKGGAGNFLLLVE